MLKRFSELENLTLRAIDGEIGSVTDLLIEDNRWQIRYLVVSVDVPLRNHEVLLSPAAVGRLEFGEGFVSTSLSSQQVFDSPPMDLNLPISRQYEQSLVDYYGWPIYWLGRMIRSPQMSEDQAKRHAAESDHPKSAVNLRSLSEIKGYHIDGRDGKAGYVKDLLIDTESWRVDYASAGSSSWLPGECSVFSTSRVQQIDWESQKVVVDIGQKGLKSPNNHAFRHAPGITGEPNAAQPFRSIPHESIRP